MRISRALPKLWNDFWFKPQSTLPICLFRICIGLLVLQTCYLLWQDILVWFGQCSLLSGPDEAHWLLVDDRSVWIAFYSLVVSSFFLTIGFCTRLSCLMVWFCLFSFHDANPYIFNGGDGLLRISAFFLMFSPCHNRLSLDSVLFARKGRSLLASPWAQRLLQIQIALIYWQAFWAKIAGAHWIDGTAVYYVAHLAEIQRIQLPFIFENIWLCKFMTWSTLVFEGCFWWLVWFKPFRYPLLLAGCALHLGIDVVINLPIFSWAMISSYLLFIEKKDQI